MSYWGKVLGYYRDFLPSDAKTEVEAIWEGTADVLQEQESRVNVADSILSLNRGYGYIEAPNSIIEMGTYDHSVAQTVELDQYILPFGTIVTDLSPIQTVYQINVDFTLSGNILTWTTDPGSPDVLFIPEAKFKSPAWIQFYRNMFGFTADPYDHYPPEVVPQMIRALYDAMSAGPEPKYQKRAISVLAGIPVSPVAGTITAVENYSSVGATTIRKITITDADEVDHIVYTKIASVSLLSVSTVVEQNQLLSVRADGFDHIEMNPYIDKVRPDNHLVDLGAGTTNLTDGLIGVWESNEAGELTKNGSTLEITSPGSAMWLRNDSPVELKAGMYEWSVGFKADSVLPFTMTIEDDAVADPRYNDRKSCSMVPGFNLLAEGRFGDQYVRNDITTIDWTSNTDLITGALKNGLLYLKFPAVAGAVQNTIENLPYNTLRSLYIGGYVNGLFTIEVLHPDGTVIKSVSASGAGEYQLKRIQFTTPTDESSVVVSISRLLAAETSIPNSTFSAWDTASSMPDLWGSPQPNAISRGDGDSVEITLGRRRNVPVELRTTLTEAITSGGIYRLTDSMTVDASVFAEWFISTSFTAERQQVYPGVPFTAEMAATKLILVASKARRSTGQINLNSVSLESTSADMNIFELDYAIVGNPSDKVVKRFDVTDGYKFQGKITFDGFPDDADAEMVLESWKLHQLERDPFVATVSSVDGKDVYIDTLSSHFGNFDGTQHVEIAAHAELASIGGTDLTIEASFIQAALGAGVLVSVEEVAAYVAMISVDANGLPEAKINVTGTGLITLNGTTAVKPYELEHIALRYDGAKIELVHNFIVEDSVNETGNVPGTATAKLKIGNDFNSNIFTGMIRYARAWNSYQTDYELLDNRNRRYRASDGLALDNTGLIESWEMEAFVAGAPGKAFAEDGGYFQAGEPAGIISGETKVALSAWVSPRNLEHGVVLGRGDHTVAGTVLMLELINSRLSSTISNGTTIATLTTPGVLRGLSEMDTALVQVVWSAAGLLNIDAGFKNNHRLYVNGNLVAIGSDSQLAGVIASLQTAGAGIDLTMAGNNDGNRTLPGNYNNAAIWDDDIDSDLASTGASVFSDPDLNSPPSRNVWQSSRRFSIEQFSGADNGYRYSHKAKSSEHTSPIDALNTVIMPTTPGRIYKIDLKVNFTDLGSGDVAGPGTVDLELEGTTLDDAIATAGGIRIKNNDTSLYDSSFLIQATGSQVLFNFNSSMRYGYGLDFFKFDAHEVSSSNMSLIETGGINADYTHVDYTGPLGAAVAFWPLSSDLNDDIGTNHMVAVPNGGIARGSGGAVPGQKSTNLDGSVV